ncbi:MAG: hypothetical protein LN566_07290, partial [Rickettsia endosymbiont of Stiretrus anchorago]|nr:hypothetical protein [Rickettsia endosymbiont of Stiretrus anchorago]
GIISQAASQDTVVKPRYDKTPLTEKTVEYIKQRYSNSLEVNLVVGLFMSLCIVLIEINQHFQFFSDFCIM